MTLDRYGHLYSEDLQNAARAPGRDESRPKRWFAEPKRCIWVRAEPKYPDLRDYRLWHLQTMNQQRADRRFRHVSVITSISLSGLRHDCTDDGLPTIRGSRSNGTRRLLRTSEVSEQTGILVATWRWWRHRGEGPPSFKIGRTVFYYAEELESWINLNAKQALKRE